MLHKDPKVKTNNVVEQNQSKNLQPFLQIGKLPIRAK